MSESIWIVLAIIAFGTFLMRVGPLYWMLRRIKRSEKDNALENIPVWLSVMGPVMIAAMFGTSLIPSTPSVATWSATAVGAVATLLLWYKTRSLGLPVLAGVVAYGIVVSLGG